jgi:cytochrome c peroxidase
MSTTEASADKYTQVRQDIAKAFPNEEYDDGSFAPVV